MLTEKAIKIIGLSATAIGMATTVVSGWVSDKATETLIEQKVAEAIAKLKV